MTSFNEIANWAVDKNTNNVNYETTLNFRSKFNIEQVYHHLLQYWTLKFGS